MSWLPAMAFSDRTGGGGGGGNFASDISYKVNSSPLVLEGARAVTGAANIRNYTID